MKWIVNFSGGLCSLFAAVRTIEQHGRENTVLLFADTLYEHPDLYRFNLYAEKYLNLPITRVCVGLTPWELFRKEGMIGNNLSPICSVRLKREPLNAWMESRYQLDHTQDSFGFLDPATVVLGFDFSEFNRVVDFQNEHPNWRVWSPMTDAPLWDKCRMIDRAKEIGFPEQTLYKLGFPHNNCGGGCVRAGISHFVHLYHLQRETFDLWEAEEKLTNEEFEKRCILGGPFAILRDRRGGVSRPMPLSELRQRIEQQDASLPTTEWGGCGCGGATK